MRKIPKFVSEFQNQTKVEEINQNTCKITSHLSANLNGIMGFLLGFILKKNFKKLIYGFLYDWKTFAETGKVSATKKREIEVNSKCFQ